MSEMLSRISSRELSEWTAFFVLEDEEKKKNSSNTGDKNSHKSKAEIEAGM